MDSEGGVVLESLPTLRAAEGPLLCVNPLMFEATGAGVKPLITHSAHVGPLPSVDALVSGEVAI